MADEPTPPTSSDTPSPSWLYPALGFAGAATTAGLLTSKKKKGETARERARRVIVNAVGAGILGGGGMYALGRGADSFRESQDPNTGNNGRNPEKAPGLWSSIPARLGITGAVRAGMHFVGGRNQIRHLGGAPVSLLPVQVDGLVPDPHNPGRMIPGRVSGRPGAVSTVAQNHTLTKFLHSIGDGAKADLVRGNVEKLKEMVTASKGSFSDVYAAAGAHTVDAQLALAKKLNRHGIYAYGADAAGKSFAPKGQFGRKLLHGAETLVGSAGRYRGGAGQRALGLGGRGSALTAAFFAPGIVRMLAHKNDNAVQDGVKDFAFGEFPGMGRPPAPKVEEQGFLSKLFTPVGIDYNKEL